MVLNEDKMVSQLPKEKDHVDPPALSRIRHFINSKIAYDLKQIQYAKLVFRYPPQVGFEASWRRLESSDLECSTTCNEKVSRAEAWKWH